LALTISDLTYTKEKGIIVPEDIPIDKVYVARHFVNNDKQYYLFAKQTVTIDRMGDLLQTNSHLFERLRSNQPRWFYLDIDVAASSSHYKKYTTTKLAELLVKAVKDVATNYDINYDGGFQACHVADDSKKQSVHIKCYIPF
jgi:hypothetical protein